MTSETDLLLLAAGLGTRLRPLTEQIPKALLPIYGTPLIDLHLARYLGPTGGEPGPVRRAVVNAHHLAAEIREHVSRHPLRDRIEISHEPEILGTGGAIAKAAPLLASDPFAVLNVDAFYAAPLDEALAFHRERGAAATLVVRRFAGHPLVRVVSGLVAEILREPTEGAFTFTGFQIVSREFAQMIPKGVFHDVRDTFRDLAKEGRLGAFIDERPGTFLDVGTPAAYLEAHRLCAAPAGAHFLNARGAMPAAHGSPAEGFGFVDARARIAPGARIAESVILQDAEIAPGARVSRSIVGPGARIEGTVDRRLVTTLGERDIEGAP